MSGKQPDYKVFVVQDTPPNAPKDAKPFWTRIGSAWPNKDGEGFNIVLSALPTNGRIVMRTYTDEDESKDDERAKARKR